MYEIHFARVPMSVSTTSKHREGGTVLFDQNLAVQEDLFEN